MLSRNLRIALGISVIIHIFLMSTVTIVPPKDLGRNEAFSKVEFLGPILEKTAFDIMLESAVPQMKTTYSVKGHSLVTESLKAPAPGKVVFTGKSSFKTVSNIDVVALGFLTANKTVPDFLLKMGEAETKKEDSKKRSAIDVPVSPVVEYGLYGDKIEFRIIMRVLVTSEGKVKTAEPATTTGYPELDIIASNFIKGWTFEPKESVYIQDEWITQQIIIKTEGFRR